MHLWPCYRLVLEGHATWVEVTEKMSLDDVDRLNMAADALFDAKHSKPSGDDEG